MDHNQQILCLDDPNRRVFAGVWDTKNVSSVSFDVSEWTETWPDGVIQISVLRPNDEIPYSAVHVVEENGIVTWTFDAVDTAYAGLGQCALVMTDGEDTRARTEPYDLYIAPTLGVAGEEVPEALVHWYNNMLQAAADALAAKTAAEAAQGYAEAAQTAAEGARDDAITAKGDAQSAQTAAETAQGLAEDARDAAAGYADDAAESATDAQTALQGMVYVTFNITADGHVQIRNGDLLGTTSFELVSVNDGVNPGHLEVDY